MYFFYDRVKTSLKMMKLFPSFHYLCNTLLVTFFG